MFALANCRYFTAKVGSVSILANKKIATANQSCVSISEMGKKHLQEFLKARVSIGGENGKLSPTEVQKQGGPTKGYVGELLDAKRDIDKMGVNTILSLATGLNEDPVLVFQAVIGKTERNFKDPSLAQILEDYSSLTDRQQAKLRFIINHLREAIRGVKADSNGDT
jgi:hypothetical protein